MVWLPTTVGFFSHLSGLMPSFPSAPDPEPGADVLVSREKLPSSYRNVAAGR
jgi:hypothetical protein